LLVPPPALLTDTDTVALAGVRRLWPTAAGRSPPASEEEPERWALTHGAEQGHINSGACSHEHEWHVNSEASRV
jgi:hypothetical protein